MTKDRALVGVMAMLVLLAFAAGCGLVSDQDRQEAKKKVDDLDEKLDDVEKKVDELLKKVDAQEQQDQKEK